MKTYNISIAKYFPKTHLNAGAETLFNTSIESGVKKHTIRLNYDIWETRFKSIDKGEGRLSLKEWTGKPYRSTQLELKSLTTYEGIGLQKMIYVNGLFLIDGKTVVTKKQLAENDGLTLNDFAEWFKGGLNKPAALIQFTKFRY